VSELGRNLRTTREAAGVSLAELARRTHYSKSLLGHLETGERVIKPEHVAAYGKALGVPVDRLHGPTESAVALDGHERPGGAPLDAEYIEALRVRICLLLDLDTQFGGDRPAEMALELFRSVHRKIGTIPCAPGIDRDLHAAAGELGEVAGWFLYDAAKHDLVRTTNLESLQLSRLAGDRSIELLTLQNMSLHAGDLGRSVESLSIARMVLGASKLSPRLEALFRTREARALAQLGDATAADRSFRRARSLYLDGVRDDDPAWVWWISDRELIGHEAMIRTSSADWSAAIDSFHASMDCTPAHEARRQFYTLANLLYAQVRAGAWRDASETMESVVSFVDEVRSTRSANTLLVGLDTLDASEVGQSVRDNSRYLRSVLADAGYVSSV
jgi:transcriptional regulator with XRE-family HTH domain